jgi:RNA polymerase sigma-70 factor (ECF subfamily)
MLTVDPNTKTASIESLYRSHGEALYQYLRSLLRDADDALDCLQTVFAKLLDRGTLVTRLDDPRSYLFRCAHNTAIDRMRKRGNEAVGTLPVVVAKSKSPDCDVEAVQKALAKLSADQRSVVVLKLYQGFTFREIATTLNAPQKTCESRYSAALKRLAELLPREETS